MVQTRPRPSSGAIQDPGLTWVVILAWEWVDRSTQRPHLFLRNLIDEGPEVSRSRRQSPLVADHLSNFAARKGFTEPDHADIWNFSRPWQREMARLRRELLDGSFPLDRSYPES